MDNNSSIPSISVRGLVSTGPYQPPENSLPSQGASEQETKPAPSNSKGQVLTVSEEAVMKAIDRANKALIGAPKKFEYHIHKNSGELIVKIRNAETNEIIREIPPEKFIDLVEKLQEITGAIIDEKR